MMVDRRPVIWTARGWAAADRRSRLPLRFWLAVAISVLIVTATPHAQSRRTDPAALAKQAVTALEARRFGEALEAFTEAARLLPRDPSVNLGAGVAAYRLGRTDEAEGWFEKALQLDPSYTTASEWLGELRYRDGRVREAIATYELALERAPRADTLERRLADWRKEAQLQERFFEWRGAHFSVMFEGPADESLARRIVERLEAEYFRIGATLTAYPSKPITVVLYTKEQFRDITRLPAWTAAAYDGRIHVPMGGALAQSAQLDRVLSHEYIHAVVAMLGGRNVPVWLNEGLAVVFEAGGTDDGDRSLGPGASRPQLQAMHGSFTNLSSAEARVAYAFSAYAVRRMIDERGPYAIIALLEDLASGVEFAKAFEQRMTMRYEDFQAMVSRD